MQDSTKIKQRFDAQFAPWGIQLAAETLTPNSRGKIEQAGWVIEYLAGADEKGPYLDYYAAHRMTNDRHVRISADGSVEDLPALGDFSFNGEESEFFERNRQVTAMLRAKGFGQRGDTYG